MSSQTGAALNVLLLGAFLFFAYRMIVARQVRGVLTAFVAQSLCLAGSAFTLGASTHLWELFALGAVTLVSKPILIPIVLTRLVPGAVYERRELPHTMDPRLSLLASAALSGIAYLVILPLIAVAAGPTLGGANVVVGFSGLLLGAYQVTIRREAIPQLLGILAMENGAFLAGISIAPDFPLIAELAIAFDIPLLAFIVGLLTRALHEQIGTTETASLTSLREESPW